MSRNLGTKLCIKCGKEAVFHCGHLKTKESMALENFVDVKVLAGWCSEECYNSREPDSEGCYGYYNNMIDGEVIDIFSK